MKLLRSFITAIMTYSIIPMPNIKWEEDNTKYAIAFFPFVGCVIAGVLIGWFKLCEYIGLGNLIFAAGCVSIPVLITGGIHIDGYMDTVDALASNQNRERMLVILKDSRVGAFAVIYEILYMIITLALFSELKESNPLVIALIYVISRAASGILVLLLPSARKNGMLGSMVGEKGKHKIGMIIWLILIIAFSMSLIWICGSIINLLFLAIAVTIAVIYYLLRVVNKLGGCTGDTAGYFLQICELCMLISLFVAGYVNF